MMKLRNKDASIQDEHELFQKVSLDASLPQLITAIEETSLRNHELVFTFVFVTNCIDSIKSFITCRTF